MNGPTPTEVLWQELLNQSNDRPNEEQLWEIIENVPELRPYAWPKLNEIRKLNADELARAMNIPELRWRAWDLFQSLKQRHDRAFLRSLIEKFPDLAKEIYAFMLVQDKSASNCAWVIENCTFVEVQQRAAKIIIDQAEMQYTPQLTLVVERVPSQNIAAADALLEMYPHTYNADQGMAAILKHVPERREQAGELLLDEWVERKGLDKIGHETMRLVVKFCPKSRLNAADLLIDTDLSLPPETHIADLRCVIGYAPSHEKQAWQLLKDSDFCRNGDLIWVIKRTTDDTIRHEAAAMLASTPETIVEKLCEANV